MARINPVYVAALSNPLPVPRASSSSRNFFTNAAQGAQDARDALSQAIQDARDRAQNLLPVDLPEVKGLGLDVVTGKTVDMVKAGIIDPLLVTKSALKNAASVATTILSTDCVINNIRI